ncbi:MAG TPA: preprotein translocase subunit SecY [Candidatus Paceibacterota bacterium]
MTTNWRDKASLLLKDKVIVKKIAFVLIGFAIFRLFSVIPIPGVDPLQLEKFFQDNQFFGLLNIFSGSGLATLSIVMLGVGPYITASIIMQLLTMMSSKLKALYHEEGEAGRQRFAQYSRRISVPLALLQGLGFLALLTRQGAINTLSPLDFAVNLMVITAGAVLLMWLGELMTEYGVGNGTSLIIFGGIVSRVPAIVSQQYFVLTGQPELIPRYLGFLAAAILIVWAVVVMTEAERPIPITYAKRVRGNKIYGGISTYLPLRINQAGVIPIIFALSIILIPQMIFNFTKNIDAIAPIANKILAVLNNGWFYSVFYFLLVFVFTYFYTAVTFDPKTISENLQKSGAFIPGVRPGGSTMEYLAKVVTRITLVGAIFLALIAVLPLAMQSITGNQALAIGGTALLIVVSVVLDLVKKIGGQIAMREY